MSNIKSELFYIIGSAMAILVNIPEIIKQINIKLQFNSFINHHKSL